MVATGAQLQLGGAFLPEEGARRLGVFLDVKIELARQVAFGAERADALWKRTTQLLWPEDRDVLLHPAPAALLRALEDEAPGTADLLGGIGLVAANCSFRRLRAGPRHEHRQPGVRQRITADAAVIPAPNPTRRRRSPSCTNDSSCRESAFSLRERMRAE